MRHAGISCLLVIRSFVLSARFPVPMSEKVSPALKRLETSFKIQKIRFSGSGYCFGTVLGTLWAPFWHHFGVLLDSFSNRSPPPWGLFGLIWWLLRHFWCPVGVVGSILANCMLFSITVSLMCSFVYDFSRFESL